MNKDALHAMNQTQFHAVMNALTINSSRGLALAAFKKRWNASPEWMQKQHGFLERACLAAASCTRGGLEFCQCGWHYINAAGKSCFHSCKQVQYCPSCNKNIRLELCKREYLPAFAKGMGWYAGSVGWKRSPKKAGLHWVTKQDQTGKAVSHRHHLPFNDRPNAPFTGYVLFEDPAELQLMAELVFEFAKALIESDAFDGLYCVFEWHFSFKQINGECVCVALPHLHFFANREVSMTFEQAVELYRLFVRTCTKCAIGERIPAYPDLEIAPIISKTRLEGWMNYMVKALPLEKFYRNGILNGCPLNALNRKFHDIVWELTKLVKSPRKYGNLFAGKGGYIGDRQYRKLPAKRFRQLKARLEKGEYISDKDQRLVENHFRAGQQARFYKEEREAAREASKQAKAQAQQAGD